MSVVTVKLSNEVAIGKGIRALNNNVLIVAANADKSTHRDIGSCNIYPACFSVFPNVITVAALQANPLYDPKLSKISDFGERHITLAAPGTRILSTDEANWYSFRDGSSSAAPFVSAVASLLVRKLEGVKQNSDSIFECFHYWIFLAGVP